MGTAELWCCDITSGVRSETETGQPEDKLPGEKSNQRFVSSGRDRELFEGCLFEEVLMSRGQGYIDTLSSQLWPGGQSSLPSAWQHHGLLRQCSPAPAVGTLRGHT